LTDIELAKNLNAKGIFINDLTELGTNEITVKREELNSFIVLETNDWNRIYEFLKLEERTAIVSRKTNETDINIQLNLDGIGKSNINTGIAFFDHMLDQLARHGQMDLELQVTGDLEVDEHHTIEDTAIALGEVFAKALGNKLGIERYGFCLPMDDCLAQAAIDFGGRNWLVWETEFKREMIGKMPTEMFFHFFKSFTDGAKANLNIKAEGKNEHHKIEAIFKAFAKAIKMAKNRDLEKMILPSTKGML
jgi:imidazoleglycerol-phosphate dehydratase/histidinol-phosphatase